jgi:nitrite reductase/ring-hydroxylating ferredoxin subunit
MSQERNSVCSLDEIKQCKRKVVQVNGRKIALFYRQGQVYAMDQQCYRKWEIHYLALV